MENAVLMSGVSKLAIHGERAGLTVEQMIRILNAGFTVEDLLHLIESCLREQRLLLPN